MVMALIIVIIAAVIIATINKNPPLDGQRILRLTHLQPIHPAHSSTSVRSSWRVSAKFL